MKMIWPSFKSLAWHAARVARCPLALCLHVFVHPRTVDIDCAGDRLRHISTQLAPAAEKHINRLHQEPCLVTMAKHTGRERRRGAVGWYGAAGSARSLSGVVSLELLSSPPATSVIFSQLLSLSSTDNFSLYLSFSLLSLYVSHTNTICIFLSLLLHSSCTYWGWPHHSTLTSYSTPLSSHPPQHDLLLSNLPFFPPF